MASDNENIVKLEGFRDLSRWNDRDVQTVIAFDKIFLPASVGACLLALAKEPDYYAHVFVGSVLLMSYWLMLSLRYRRRIFDRFRIMQGMECGFGFRAHTALNNNLGLPRDYTLRKVFFGVFLFVMFPPVINWLGKVLTLISNLCN